MSQILKALYKAQKEHQHPNPSEGAPHTDGDASIDSIHPSALSRIFYMNLAICGVLVLLVIIALTLNYTISARLISTQSNMASIEKNLKSQQEKLNKNNELIKQLEITSTAQRKEFSVRLDQLSANVDAQLKEANKDSKSQYLEMSKTIEQQQKNIERLSKNYEQLNDSVREYKAVNQKSIDEINVLKQRLKELGLGRSGQ